MVPFDLFSGKSTFKISLSPFLSYIVTLLRKLHLTDEQEPTEFRVEFIKKVHINDYHIESQSIHRSKLIFRTPQGSITIYI